MSLINLSVKHGQTPEVAREQFVKAIGEAQTQFAKWIHRVDWGTDRTSATLHGMGIEIQISVDDLEVHAHGDVPFFARFLEAPLKKILNNSFPGKQLPAAGSPTPPAR